MTTPFPKPILETPKRKFLNLHKGNLTFGEYILLDERSMIMKPLVMIVTLGLLFASLTPGENPSFEERNYWNECNAAGKMSQQDFITYVDGLNLDNLIILGIQAGDECHQEHLRNEQDITSLDEKYVAMLSMIVGRFLQQAQAKDSQRLFLEPIRDTQAPFVWRKTLLRCLIEVQDSNPNIVRTNNYELLHVVNNILMDTAQDPAIRTLCCQAGSLVLAREHRNTDQSKHNRTLLSTMIFKDQNNLIELLNSENTPQVLRTMASKMENMYREKGLWETNMTQE